MANQNIAVKLTLAGSQQVVKGIEEIEIALKAAKLEQSRFTQGSTQWKQYELEINNAGKALDRFKSRQQGIQSLEKQLGAFLKVGGLLTSTFTSAAAAITLFGGDSEKVAKAAAIAQTGLAVSLTIVSFAKEEDALATVKQTVAQVASNAAVNTGNKVMKAFFLTIAANPLTALTVAIGALVGIFFALAQSTDEAAESQKEFNEALNADIAKSVTSFQRLKTSIEDTNLSLETRKKALNDLKQLAPSYFKDLKDEDILTGRVKIATEQLTTALIAQAKARALQGRVEDTYLRQLDLEEQLAQATAERIAAERAARSAGLVSGGGSLGATGGAGVQQQAAQQRVISATKEEQRVKNELLATQRELAGYEGLITKINQETDAVIGNTDATDENADALERAKKAQEAFETALRNTLDLQAALNQLTLESAEFFQAEESTVLQAIDKLLERQNEIITRRRQTLKSDQQKLTEEIRELFLDIFPAESDLVKLYDQYSDIVKNFDLLLLQSAANIAEVPFDINNAIQNGITFDGIIQGLLDNSTGKAKEFFEFILQNSENLSEKQKADITRYFATILDQAKTFASGLNNGFFEANLSVENSLLLLNSLGAEYQQLESQVKAGSITQRQADEQAKQLIRERLAAIGLERKETAGLEGSKLVLAQAYNNELEKQVSLLLGLTQSGQEYRQGIIDTNAQIESQVALLIKQREELGQPLSDEQLEGFKQFFKQRAQQFPTLIREFLLNPDSFKRLGEDAIDAAIEGINEGLQAFEPKTRDEVQKLISYLEIVGQEIANTFGFDENPFGEKIDKLKEKLNQLPTDAEIQFEKTVKKLQSFIADLQIALNSIQQAATAYYNFQFEQLEKRNRRIQDTIVGTSEEANKKRLEADKAYQAERERLEKKQAKLSLRIALVQSIANTAEAVTRSLGNPILAAIVGAAGVVQTGIIIEQINAIDTYRRGGRLKKMQTGGFLQGPSHEFGGVKFQNGGIELEGGEAIINRQSTIQYASLLSSINMAGGGKPIVMNNFDDSRLIEAIAKQRNMPLRAFVVESDITQSQTTQRRLEQLAQI